MAALDFSKMEVGQKLNFAKDFGTPVEGKVSFNLNWGKIGNQSVDLDSILVMESRNGAKPFRVKRPLTMWQRVCKFFGMLINDTYDVITDGHRARTETVYFGNLHAQGVIHHGDDRTGAWAKGEFIEIDLDKLHPSIDTLTLSVLSFSGHDFSKLPFAEIKVFTGTPTSPKRGLVSHSLKNFSFGTRSVFLAQLTRDSEGNWTIEAKAVQDSTSSVDRITSISKGIGTSGYVNARTPLHTPVRQVPANHTSAVNRQNHNRDTDSYTSAFVSSSSYDSGSSSSSSSCSSSSSSCSSSSSSCD